ncbi:hypothetical protein RhiirA5_460760 [Rhizophagus irregularis]|uniref:Uncharacterized protein n=1 Tax=Rhizophagus irregularis TaxID=588596 RepID=A0A2N0P428_9GLOM|nr:hypothetical protein RhiirA5_456153 [Rhizophagus irregularis]PKC13164.1 hypothetical protein RhiirA5_460760 [Rhizophagus irregularis]
MISEYSCPFLCNTGKACGNSCIRPKGCRFHWKAKKRVPCSDCGKPTASACGQCPDHVRGYYVTQYYIRLRLELLERLRLEMRERTFDEIMVRHRDALAKLNISLCKECLLPIKLEEEVYCDSCRSE